MKLGPIALRIREITTRFGNMVGGAAEFALAEENTFEGNMAFVLPLREAVTSNDGAGHINQVITERFAVVVALYNDTEQAERMGLGAYDTIDEIRSELFKALLGWQIPEGTQEITPEGIIEYAGGRLLSVNSVYLWYQYEFEYETRIDDDDGMQDYSVDDFLRIYAQYVLEWDER